MKLDKKDTRILELLSINCRYSTKDIAKAVNLSKDAIRYRINNLIKNKYIYKFITLINFSSFGYDQYYISLQLQNLTSTKEKIIIERLRKNSNVFFLVKTSGRWDFFIGLACKDTLEFEKTLRQVYSICGANLLDSESVIWIKDYKYTHTIEGIKLGTVLRYKNRDPSFSKELFGKKKEFEIKKVKIDKKDLRILKVLAENPRIELKELGRKTKLTGEGARYRIRRLIEKEVILGFTAIPNYFKLGYQSFFLLGQAKNLTAEKEKKLQSFLQQKDYTVISFKTIGKYDILISISVKDLEEFNKILTEIKENLSGIIQTYETLPLLDWYKYTLFPKGLYN